MDLIRSLTCVSASHLRLVRDDDSHVDRLSHRYTVVICVIFAIIVTTKQYAGDPIDCWVPAQFKASYEKYADSYCWIAGSWYTPMDKELPLSERERRSNRIRYYQWVPFLLLFQAILCYIPRIIWRTLNVRSGLDIINLVDAAIKYESVDKFSDRDKIMEYIVRNIERYIGARRSRYERLYGRQLCSMHHNSRTTSSMAGGGGGGGKQQSRSRLALCCCRCWIRIKIAISTVCFWTGKRLGNYLVVLYMFVKTLWLTNAVSQLFLLNRFIGNDYHAFGVEIIEMLLSGQEWHELRHFPRVTYCDFKIREIGNQHDWTVQCVLRINLFNEVIYIFMWFWLCILALCSLVDFITWTFRIIIPRDKLRFVKRHLDIEAYLYGSGSSKRASAAAAAAAAKRGSTMEAKSMMGPSVVAAAGATGGSTLHHRGSRPSNVGGREEAGEYGVSGNEPHQPTYMDIEKEKRLMRDFTFSYLKDDGVFALRIMASSASDLIVTEIMSELWKNYKMSYNENSGDEVSTLVSSPSSSSSQSSSSSSSASHSHASSPASNQHSPNSLIKKQPFNFPGSQMASTPPPPPKLSQYSAQQPPTQTIYPSSTTSVQSPLVSNGGGGGGIPSLRQYTPSAPFASPPIVTNSMLPPLPPPQHHHTSSTTPPPLQPSAGGPMSDSTGDPSRRSSYGLGVNSKDLFGPSSGGGGGGGLQHRHPPTDIISNANPNAKDTHV